MATGNIKKYVLWVTSIGFLVFPLTILVYYLGAPVETTYVVFAVLYIGVDSVRLWIMKGLLDFPVAVFVKEVVLRIIIVTTASIIIPIVFVHYIPQSIMRFILSIIISIMSASLSSYIFGLTKQERKVVVTKAIELINKKFRRI